MSAEATTTRDAALEEIRGGERFLLLAHENPDGDALGSLVATQGMLAALGKDSVAYLDPKDLPLPYEYRFLDVDAFAHEAPADLRERTIVFLDCGNLDRTPFDVSWPGAHVLNVDHHHDNTLFGSVNHVVAHASCTAEIVWDLMGALDVRPTRAMADALYVALVTDTGRFQYESTGRTAHLMAADLVDHGVDVHAIYRRLYEGMPYAKVELLSRALDRIERFEGGALAFTHVTQDDFEATGAQESYTEGIIDHLRSIEGTRVAALVRERATDPPTRKASLRSTDGTVDVSRIARAQGGGGHRRAAGFTTTMSVEELIAFVLEQMAAQAGTPSA